MIDPDSPFAHLGAGSADDKRIGLRDVGTMLCRSCAHQWLTPVTHGGSNSPTCPVCASKATVLRDGSVRRETAPRV